jgi:carbamoyltransferase
MRYVGYSEKFHDAGLAIINKYGDIVHASHAERYSKIKNDPFLHQTQRDMLSKNDHITYYEDPNLRLKWIKEQKDLRRTLVERVGYDIDKMRMDVYCKHHISHAAGAFYTRPWESKDDTVILTIDGFGEYQSATILDSNFNLLHEIVRPKSIGQPYSWITKELGLRPLEDEYVVMGLSSYGEYSEIHIQELDNIYNDPNALEGDFIHLYKTIVSTLSREDAAATIQKWTEDKIYEFASLARKYGSKLVYSGGVAQNIIANTKIRDLFDDMWMPPAVTDAGSALGAAAYSYGKATGKDKINWTTPFLGYNIDKEINPREVVDHLLKNQYCGVANGRAEYGPRALGNRSLIADVRYDVKDTVNAIKQRQKYRPFAPAILEEHADEYFEGHMNEYMQYTAKAKHDYSSVTHVDGTARVQILKPDSDTIFRKIVEEYYERTGVPMLLNTSLNIRGRPMVNDELDAKLFEQKYNVKVF